MPENKNQHFVPRCYLRAFTKNGENKTVQLFNIDRETFVERAAVKNQCSRDYFYGKSPSLEATIQGIETSYASVLREVASSSHGLEENQARTLKHFWLFQHMRTEAALQWAADSIAETDVVAGDTPTPVDKKIEEAIHLTVTTYLSSKQVVDDLKCCLVLNESPVPFVTSDNPSTLTNKWYLTSSRTRGMSFGQGAAGNLLIIPLTPKLLLLGYDGDVYRIKSQSNRLTVSSPHEISFLNEHQYLNCMSNIYFRGEENASYVREVFETTRSLRPVARHAVSTVTSTDRAEELVRHGPIGLRGNFREGDTLVRMRGIQAKPSGWPSFIALRQGGRAYYNGTSVGYARRAATRFAAGPNMPKFKRISI